MIWLIGNKGMLGQEIEKSFVINNINYISSDLEIDITSYEKLKEFSGNNNINWIINCAAYTNVDNAEKEQDIAFQINEIGALNIAKISKYLGAKLIHFSTDYIFSGKKEIDSNGYNENDNTKPLSIYGKSKLAGEKEIIKELKNYYILRISWLYGMRKKNFVLKILNLLKNRDKLKVVNDQWGSPTYTKDVAFLLVDKILNDKKNNFGIYHFSNEGKITRYNFALKIYEYAKKFKIINKEIFLQPVDTSHFSTAAERPAFSYMSKKKIKKVFNLNIRKWDEALEEYIEMISQD